MAAVNLTVKLNPARRVQAQSCVNLLRIIANGDQKLYARGKAFLPIFPTDNVALQQALTTVNTQLENVLGILE